MLAAPQDLMGYFEPQERRTAQITARVTKSVKTGVADLARLWSEMEKARLGDPEAEVTESDVINRLLKIGLDGAWAEVGGQPQNEEQWDRLLKTASKQAAKK